MKISQLTVESFKVGEKTNTIYDDSLITDVVFSGVRDNLKNNKWCIVFGNSTQVDERVKTVINKYREGRYEKIILCGGTGGISNSANNSESEASRYNNTFENIENAMKIIIREDGMTDSLSIISSEYHLKRCYLAFAKMYPNIKITMIPAYDGYSDKNNWFKSNNDWNTGRCIVTWERNLLTKYAKDDKIADSDIKKLKLKNN